MNTPDDDRFRVRPGAPQSRPPKFVSQVLKEVSKAGGKSLNRAAHKLSGRPGARLGRGHTAARFTGHSLQPGSRRVTIKTRLVNLKQAGASSTSTHLRYIEREGVGRIGEPGQAYGATTDKADLTAFEAQGQEDRHQFRFIVSPEDAAQLDDLRTYTRHLMSRMESDLGTHLDWVAVDHWNTDNPHTHIVLRGKDDAGKDLIISRDYIAQGMRERASELATEWLGLRSERDMQQSLEHEVNQERWTSLDRSLQRTAQDGVVHTHQLTRDPLQAQLRQLLIGRLQHLQRMELALETATSVWTIEPKAEQVLRAMGERGDVVRTMQRAMGGVPRELMVFTPGGQARSVIGRVAAKGMADELYDRGYLVVDGLDGKAHYVALGAKVELAQYPVGSVVEARGSVELRTADKTIAALAVEGIYRTDDHLALAKKQTHSNRDPQEVVIAHVRRLEALRRANVVERLSERVWRIPADLPERGRQYDAHRLGGVAVELHSHLSIEDQTRALGATWLDQQLMGGVTDMGGSGFAGDVQEALRQRGEFLVAQGLAERRAQGLVFARNLLATLRNREVESTARGIALETGLTYRPTADGERVTGIYRRSLQLASGRFAMLDDGIGFSLVPWKPVIEQRLGQSLTAVIRANGVSWEFGRQLGPSGV
jgi:type IV secretory pathway VirD2 relaxase